MRYSKSVKRAYIALCQRYNAADVTTDAGQSDFIRLSLELHAAKASVPIAWGRTAFVRRCGTLTTEA